MTDSVARLYEAVIVARNSDPAKSRTARLLRAGRAKMAKKLAEEAVEVVIDAMHGQPEAVVRESADLLYNLVVLWVHAGVHPDDVWAEMRRREQMFGIAEKVPKDMVHGSSRRKVVALETGASASAADPPSFPALSVSMTVQAAEPRSLLRRLYDWCMAAAHKPHALWTMGAIAFAESSFFPVPPDVMLIPMALARPPRAYVMAAWCTVASVAGGIVGYAIGALLYDSVGAWLIHLYGYGDKVETFRAAYAQWGAWIILLKGLTPIPYKIVTITSCLLYTSPSPR